MSEESAPTVLIVEDEPDVAETYELWFTDRYDVRCAESGEEALESLESLESPGKNVEVVLLDRMMPRMSGDEVLAELRDRGYGCRVAMVSAVDPGFDIIEMGFDSYVTKPPTRERLLSVVEDLLARGDYADRVKKYRSLVDKRAVLQAEKSEAELAASDSFASLEREIEQLEEELDRSNDRLLDDSEFVGTLRELTDEGTKDPEREAISDTEGEPRLDTDEEPRLDTEEIDR